MEDSDVTIEADGMSARAHLVLLLSQSPVLAQFLSASTTAVLSQALKTKKLHSSEDDVWKSEVSEGKIVLKGLHMAAVMAMLRFFYYGETRLSCFTCIVLAKFAIRFGIASLQHHCEQRALRVLTKDDFSSILSLARVEESAGNLDIAKQLEDSLKACT
eukprot:CAMPEP_0177689044 /NCGR_PEP_ID=MMETSP0447-20121125/34964_1 /TAXON_ID=0 /ORGANISM="Stygamoeba regulata, Strain BSH-02190019" /LENGTH=158 /DNA_ID=CAMNT_0019199351 /DNA_START=83 /DNA_END=559 /DNA_ORIENTATION=+